MSSPEPAADRVDKRSAWEEAATDHVLEHGLIGLSLRPLAAAIGTSDRMLIYHFGSKDGLVAAVLRNASRRATQHVEALPASADLAAAVADLWAAVTEPLGERCQRVYVEAAALRLFGEEPYASEVRAANEVWTEALVAHLAKSGVGGPVARRIANLVDATFLGLQLDLPLEDARATREREQVVADLVSAAERIASRA